MPLMPRQPSTPNTEEARLAAPQGGGVAGPSHFGVDYDGPPVADDSNHVREMAAAHEGRPTIAQQQKWQGMA